jgi:hypothetical protein
MWVRGEKLPSQILSSMMTCPCGEAFDSHALRAVTFTAVTSMRPKLASGYDAE